MKIRMTNEAKTGVVVLISAAVLLALVLKVGNFKLFQQGYTVKSQFHYTAGVKKHAPVRLSGVDVGEVKEINIRYGDETLIELVLWVQDGVKLRSDSKAYVTTLGLMGEKSGRRGKEADRRSGRALGGQAQTPAAVDDGDQHQVARPQGADLGGRQSRALRLQTNG